MRILVSKVSPSKPSALSATKSVKPSQSDFNQSARMFSKSWNGVLSKYSETTMTPRDARTIWEHIIKKMKRGDYGVLLHEDKATKQDIAEVTANWKTLRTEYTDLLNKAKNQNGTFKIPKSEG